MNWIRIQIAALLAVAAGATAQAEVFGTGTNQFTLDFVGIGYPGNVGDTKYPVNGTGPGSVGYGYRIGVTEVSVDQLYKARTADPRISNGNEDYWNDGIRTVGSNAPAAYCTWYEAARFANWLTSGDAYAGVYRFDTNGTLVAIDRASAVTTYGVVYLLPTEDEWYKAAYYRPVNDGSYSFFSDGTTSYPQNPPIHGTTNGWNYLLGYPTNGTVNPPPDYMWETGCGGVEQNGTHDMNGNVWEWCESAGDGVLDDLHEGRVIRDGSALDDLYHMSSFYRHGAYNPTNEHRQVGFRIASIPVGTYYVLTVSANGSGTVGLSGGFYPEGTNLILTASPAPGWLFMGWSGDLAGDYSASVTNLLMDGDKSVAALFSDDADGDGLLNIQEDALGTDPRNADTDGDSIGDAMEIALGLDPAVDNTTRDSDGDFLTDVFEVTSLGTDPLAADSDADGLSDGDEVNGYGTDPLLADTDADTMPDGWEVGHGTDPLVDDAAADADADGLTNLQEYEGGTEPLLADTDADALPDGWEVGHGLDPNLDDAALDPDADGLSNAGEFDAGTDPEAADSDDDGLSDGDEVLSLLTNPLDADTDGDGLDDGSEITMSGTDPLNTDTDADTFSDGTEVANGGDPLVSDLWRIDYIRSHGAEYDLYPSNAVVDLRIGQAVFAVTNGRAVLQLQLEESFDLIAWTNAGDTVIWTVPVDSGSAFYRVRSGD